MSLKAIIVLSFLQKQLQMTIKIKLLSILIFFIPNFIFSQNSMIGDGFGGRLWYTPTNYTVGSYSAYAICGNSCGNNAQLYSWGANQYGQLGIGTMGLTAGTSTPAIVPGMVDIKYFTTGYCMVAIKNDNSGWVWGQPWLQTPLGTLPIQVITDVNFADAGTFIVAFVKNDGTVWSVGSNRSGSFGDGNITEPTTASPSKMTGISNAVRVAVGQATTIVLLRDGTVWATGKNIRGGLGNNSTLTNIALSPVQVTGLTDIVDIKANEGANLALDKNGDVFAWGSNGWGCIGNGAPYGAYANQVVPVKIPGLSNIVAISGCDDGIHFMALNADHNCYAWGFNAYGQLGTGNYNAVLTPSLVATDVDDIMAGETFSYLVKTDSSLWASGGSPYSYDFTTIGSIWMNLSNSERRVFTQINPMSPPMNLCQVVKIFSTNAVQIACGTIQVNVAGGQAPYTYDIGKGAQSSNIFSGLSSGNYSVIVKDKKGCTKATYAKVILGNGVTGITISKSNPTCGLQNGTITIQKVIGGTSPYQFSVNGSSYTSNSNYSNLAADTFTISSKDTLGCQYTDTISLQNLSSQPTIANAGFPQIIFTSTTTLNANQPLVGNGKWAILSGSGSINSPLQFNTAITNLSIGKTKLRWSISNSCGTSNDEVEISVKFKNGQIFVPSAFTPNNDGLNDYFNFTANPGIKIGYFKVYNRWGQLIFSNSQSNLGWNGFYNGAEQPNGIYIWILQAIDEFGKTIDLKGTVGLIR